MIDVLQPEAAGAARPTLLTFLLPRRPTVLLAESDERASAALVLLLAALGFHALEARDAAEAIEIVREEPAVDILLVADDVSGLPVAELVATAQKLSPRLDYLVMSDRKRVPAIDRGRVLVKPFGHEALKAALERLLRGRPAEKDPSILQ